MTADGEYLAVLDRFEEDLAVLLLEQDGEQIDEFIVSKDDLPDPARRQDAILTVFIEDEQLIDANYDADETEARKETAQSRFDQLAERPPKDDES